SKRGLLALLEVHLGDNVTLECSFPEEETNYIHYMYWFKFIIGQTPQLIAASHKYTEEATLSENFNSGRFKVKLGTGINHLIISRTESSDSAMYYCATRSDYTIQFGPGTLLRIKGNTHFLIFKYTLIFIDPVHPGDSVTLQCTVDSDTCAGEHSVYWFRHGSGESLPGLIYTHGNRSDECEKSPERNLSCSDAGIYYCAVVTCGDILFGNGTELDIKGPTMHPIIPALGAALFICVIVIVVLVCTRNAKKCCESCTGRLYHYYNLQYNS
uniref:Ig-like domain-containing protein n=1 Tax=Scleropages formosus TaxID=113540 RepID=A0A8C9SR28_SCLFO